MVLLCAYYEAALNPTKSRGAEVTNGVHAAALRVWRSIKLHEEIIDTQGFWTR